MTIRELRKRIQDLNAELDNASNRDSIQYIIAVELIEAQAELIRLLDTRPIVIHPHEVV